MNQLKHTRQGEGSELLGPAATGLVDFRREIDRAIERAWQAFGQGSLFEIPDITPWPAIDVSEDDKGITLRVDAPGLEAKDIAVEVSGNQLTIRGSREEEVKEEENGYSRHERRTGSFTRTVTLPDYVDADKFEAQYDKGVLTLTAPKVPGAGPKRVPVKTA